MRALAFLLVVGLTLPLVGPVSQAVPLPGSPQDDAGSGGDAPHYTEEPLTVALGTVHHGRLDSQLNDIWDSYRLPVQAGQAYHAVVQGLGVCADFITETNVFDAGCGQSPQREFDHVATTDGWLRLAIWFPFAPGPHPTHDYSFIVVENGVPADYQGYDTIPHSDAGRGYDAPEQPEAWYVAPPTMRSGFLEEFDTDVYAFTVGSSLTTRIDFTTQAHACVTLMAPSGMRSDTSCLNGGLYSHGIHLEVATPEEGTWYAWIHLDNELPPTVAPYQLGIAPQ